MTLAPTPIHIRLSKPPAIFLDAFAAFEEVGDPFDPAIAARLQEHILSAGGSEEAEVLYTRFRGRMPGVEALLKGRGLLDVA
jgi:peptidyl-dipeptidase Dcp